MSTATAVHPSPTGLRLTGRVDVHVLDPLQRALSGLAPTGTSRVEMEEVTFLDSAALAALVAAHRSHREAGGALVLAAPSQAARIILEVTGLDRVLDVRAEVRR